MAHSEVCDAAAEALDLLVTSITVDRDSADLVALMEAVHSDGRNIDPRLREVVAQMQDVATGVMHSTICRWRRRLCRQLHGGVR